jgi:putative ABC transport system permease protein
VRLLRIALRNIGRNTRRTAVTVVTIVIGVMVIVFARGLVLGFQNETVVNMVETRTGDIQIHVAGYRETLDTAPLDLTMGLSEIAVELSGVTGVRDIAGRILFSGRLVTEEESAVMLGKAVDVERELTVCPRLRDGVTLGEFLVPGEGNAIVLTGDLHRMLDVEPGETVTLFATSREGAINATELVLRGVIESDLPDANRKTGYIPLSTAQDLLLMDGEVTEVVIKAEEDRDIDAIAAGIGRVLSGRGLEVDTWEVIERNIRRMLANHDFLAMVVTVILFVIVFSTVMNTMLMVVLERTNEIGTMTAFGFKRRHILSLFLLEGGLKGAFGGAVGTGFGAVAVIALKATGMPFHMPGGSGMTYLIRPEIDIRTIVLALALSVGSALLATLYPAGRAARMHPVEALRSV